MAFTIAYLKLITGEDIICMLDSEDMSNDSPKIKLIHPYKVDMVLAEDGEYDCRSQKWALFMETSSYADIFWIPKNLVMLSGKADKDVSEAYETWVQSDVSDEEDEVDPEETKLVFVPPAGIIH